jgi:hypothetical protein
MRKICTMLLALSACDGATSMNPTVGTVAGTYSETITIKAGGNSCALSVTVDGVEDASTPWLCPTCKIMYRSPFQPTTGASCLMPFFGGELPPDMWIGWTADDKLYLGIGDGFATVTLGTVTRSGASVQSTIAYDDANVTRAGTVQLTVGSKNGDRLQGWTRSASYRCGWPRTNPPPYTGNNMGSAGSTIPDAVLTDQCGDKVRLHDLLGRYLVIEMNQTKPTTCGPCDMAAQGQAAFEADMKTLGIETLVVGLMVPQYTQSNFTPAPADLQSWVTTNSVKGIALADRGLGLSAVSAIATHGSPMDAGYPSFVVVGPDGTALTGDVGYDAMRWGSLRDYIKMHAGK